MSKFDTIPDTGVAKFDALAVDSPRFNAVIDGLKARGINIQPNRNLSTAGGEFAQKRGKVTFTYNPNTLTYLDIRHELVHARQLKQQGLDAFNNIPANELEAYGFEAGKALQYEFSSDYVRFLMGRIDDYAGQ